MRSRTQNSLINMSWGIILQILTLILSFVSRTIFIRYLSTEYLGINGLFSNILLILSFSELGIGDAIIFALYKPMKERDELRLCQLMELFKIAYRYVALAIAILGLGVSFFLDYLIAEKPDIPENFQLVFLLFLFNTVSSYLLTYKKSILFADQKKYIVSIFAYVFRILQLVFQSVFLLLTSNYFAFLLIQIVFTLAGNISISVYIEKAYPFLRQKEIPPLPKQEKESFFYNTKALAVSKIAAVVSNGSDNLIISKILGLTTVGLASNYTMIINAVNMLAWNAISGITNSLGNFNVDSDVANKRSVFDELFLATYWIYSFICVCLMTLINPFIRLWLGEAYTLSNHVPFALVLIIYVGGVNFAAYSFHITLGYFDKLKYWYVASALLNILLSIIWGLKYGLVGIYLATSVSRLLTSEIADGYYVYNNGLERNPMLYYCKYILFFAVFGGNYLLTNACVSLVGDNTIFGFFIKTIVCVFVSNVLFLLCFGRTEELRSLAKRILQVLRLRMGNKKKRR